MCTEYARKILSEFVIEADTGEGARNGTKSEHFGGCKNQEINFLFSHVLSQYLKLIFSRCFPHAHKPVCFPDIELHLMVNTSREN